MNQPKYHIAVSHCIKCGAAIAALHTCHACGYVQDAIYEEEHYNLETPDYHLSLRFYPALMISNFRLFREYAADIRQKLVTFDGRGQLKALDANG